MEETFYYIIFAFSLLAVVITAGVVWRVEKRLDISYKFLLIAISIFSIGAFLDIMEFYNIIPAWQWQKIIKTLFIIFFTIGVFEMRTLIIGLEDKGKK